jgi:signal transduction histidine kinase
VVVWPLVPAMMAGALAIDIAAADDGPSLSGALADGSFVALTLAPYVVGLFLTLRVPGHGAGWSFLGLATSIAWSAFSEEYGLAAVSDEVDMPGGALMATFSDSSFLGWFVFLTLCLHYTAAIGPTRAKRLPGVTLAAAVGYQVFVLLRSTSLAEPFEGRVSPLAVPAIAGPARIASAVLIIGVGLCLLASVYELFSAFRRSRGEARQQLLWLAAGAAPLGPGVVAAFAVSYAGNDTVALPIVAFCIVTLSLGAALSVVRYRLYDVERVVTDSSAYALSSGAVIAAFGLIVVVITRTVPVGPESPLSTVLGTFAATAVARPAYLWARNRVDRRFNKRRFDAVRIVESGLTQGAPNVERLLRTAIDDPAASLVFDADGAWVTADGRNAEPGAHAVDIERHGAVTARLRFDPARTDPGVVEAVATAAAAEIDNLGLRAELARHVEQVTESRARLATAHLDERRRMERDLHDGAQQRLLALALQLQSARINDDHAVLRAEIDRAVGELGATVQDLRALASGLQPAALAGGGLRAATEELAVRTPLLMQLDVGDQRYSSTLEGAAWFVIAEGVANAVKHARADKVAIRVQQSGDDVHVIVTDDGVGGADPTGSGLQGLADRVAALGGELRVRSRKAGGTHLEAVFPCGS